MCSYFIRHFSALGKSKLVCFAERRKVARSEKSDSKIHLKITEQKIKTASKRRGDEEKDGVQGAQSPRNRSNLGGCEDSEGFCNEAIRFLFAP